MNSVIHTAGKMIRHELYDPYSWGNDETLNEQKDGETERWRETEQKRGREDDDKKIGSAKSSPSPGLPCAEGLTVPGAGSISANGQGP